MKPNASNVRVNMDLFKNNVKKAIFKIA